VFFVGAVADVPTTERSYAYGGTSGTAPTKVVNGGFSTETSIIYHPGARNLQAVDSTCRGKSRYGRSQVAQPAKSLGNLLRVFIGVNVVIIDQQTRVGGRHAFRHGCPSLKNLCQHSALHILRHR